MNPSHLLLRRALATVARPAPARTLACVALSITLGIGTVRAADAPAASAFPAAAASADGAGSSARPARPVYMLSDLLALAATGSPLLTSSSAEEAVARAGAITARAWPGTEVSLDAGRIPARSLAPSGTTAIVSVSQPLENPWLRQARADAAGERIELAQAQTGVARSAVAASVRRAFAQTQRFRDEAHAFEDDLALASQIRDRVAVKVQVGEAARFDLERAEGEVELARKNLLGARMRADQAILELRQHVGPSMPHAFEMGGPASDLPALVDADLDALAGEAMLNSPQIRLAQRRLALSQHQLAQERGATLPQFALRATREQEPEGAVSRVGAVVTLALGDRRRGPLEEASARVALATRELERQQFELRAGLDVAWAAYRSARALTAAIEGGILERARTVLRIAEAAYRLGERGILEYLDAQRQFRLLRNELIAARAEQHAARIDIERLIGR